MKMLLIALGLVCLTGCIQPKIYHEIFGFSAGECFIHVDSELDKEPITYKVTNVGRSQYLVTTVSPERFVDSELDKYFVSGVDRFGLEVECP